MSGVVIGQITLADFETPEQIVFGGTQRLAVHRLPGGGRVIDALGADDRNIGWSGMMIGPNASARAQALDRMRQSGAVVSLVFGDMAFRVVVASFEAAYRRSSWIGSYRISCLVAPVLAASSLTLGAALSADLATLGAIDPTGVLGGVGASVTTAQAALVGQATLTVGTSVVANVGASLQAISASAVSVQASAEAALSPGSFVGGPSAFSSVSLQNELLAKSAVAVGLAGRASNNLAAEAL